MFGLRQCVVLGCLLAASLAACAPPEVPEYRRAHGLVLLDLPPSPPPAVTDDDRARAGEAKDDLDTRVAEESADLGGDQGVQAKAALEGVATTTVSSTGERGPNTRVQQHLAGLVPPTPDGTLVPLAPVPAEASRPDGSPPTPVVVTVAPATPPPRDAAVRPVVVSADDEPSLSTPRMARGPRSAPMQETGLSENERVVELGGQEQASPEVLQVLRGQRNALQRCYDALTLRAPATTEGNVTVRFTLSPAGEVQAADVIGGTLDDVDFRQCVVGRLQGLTFPRADSGAVFTHPFRFGGGPGLGAEGE